MSTELGCAAGIFSAAAATAAAVADADADAIVLKLLPDGDADVAVDAIDDTIVVNDDEKVASILPNQQARWKTISLDNLSAPLAPVFQQQLTPRSQHYSTRFLVSPLAFFAFIGTSFRDID